jgi:IS30 family transposase
MTKRPKSCLLEQNLPLCELVLEKLEVKWSLEQISGWLRRTKPRQKTLRISPETVYKTLYFRNCSAKQQAEKDTEVQNIERDN